MNYSILINNKTVIELNSLVACVYYINRLPKEQYTQYALIDNITGEVLSHYQYISNELINRYYNNNTIVTEG